MPHERGRIRIASILEEDWCDGEKVVGANRKASDDSDSFPKKCASAYGRVSSRIVVRSRDGD